MKHTLLLITSLIFTTSVFAQTGTCERAEAEAYLDINNVRARIFNNGSLVYRGEPHIYEVPRFTGKNAIFAAGLWVGGKVDGQLRTAASSYGPWEFWPGPLDEAGNPPADCKPYDKIYSIYQTDIDEFEKTDVATEDLLNWPWQLGAPVVDGDGDPNNYNLAGGDRPEIIGHQTLWWIMNDRGNVHERTGTESIGLEVQVTAFAAASTEAHINNATLYRYKIKYKGEAPLEDTHFGFFYDVDLGNVGDDYTGSDSTLSMGYVYNADNDDEGAEGYGTPPPAVGFDLLQGPLADNDGLDNDKDTEIDEPGERIPATIIYTNFKAGVQGDPDTAEDFYNYLTGYWLDGRRFTLGGKARDFSSTPTNYIFSGDPVTGEGWSELNPAIDGSQPPLPPADRRGGVNTGPITLQPGDEQEIVIGMLWARGENNLDSVTELKEASRIVQEAFDSGFNISLPDIAPLPTLTLRSPANGAFNQPLNPILRWQAPEGEHIFLVEISTSPTFQQVTSSPSLINFFQPENLRPDTTYFWRVRAANAGFIGPWSETWSFSTNNTTFTVNSESPLGFMATQNAAGPLEPPDMAAFAFNGSGFPILEGTFTPAGSYPSSDRPTRGIQQSTNAELTWGIHTGVGVHFWDTDEESFLEHAFPQGLAVLGEDSFEWRFPQSCLDQINGLIEQEDCLAYRAFDDSLTIEVPFELWNIGSLIDPNDDYQMIPFICEEACGAGRDSLVFDFAGDHPISGGDNDPFSDWIYWMNPADNGASSGKAGYLDFFFGSGIAGEQVIAELVLVQWNGGDEPPYLADLPEPGTVFRIANRTTSITAPLPAAPLDGAILDSTTTTLHWNGIPGAIFELQIDTRPDFTSPDLEVSGLTDPFYEAINYPLNTTYYWRVKMRTQGGAFTSEWSTPWSFTIPINVDNELLDLPEAFSLSQSYPNPFSASTTISYTLPEAAPVKLEVYDTLGRRVQMLVDAQQPAGHHQATFNATNFSNGVYFYRLTAGAFTDTKTMTLIR